MQGLVSNNQSIPLIAVTFVGNVVENIGVFTVEQEYVNSSNKRLETIYIFPLSLDVTITDVVLKLNDKTLQSKLIEKKEARQQYSKAIEEKHKTMLLEKNDSNYLIKVGNIEPFEKVSIKYTYFQDIKYDGEKYSLIIPTNIAPHYSSNTKSTSTSSLSNIKYSNKNETVFNVDIKWTSSNDITEFRTLTHISDAVIKKESNCCQLTLKTVGLTQDFNLFCKTKTDIDVMCNDDGKNIYSCYYIKLDEQETKCDPSTFTNIFVLDCSGSMFYDRTKIIQALEALRLFFMSLTIGSYYNIIIFGTSYELLYNENKIYNEVNFKNTIEKIKTINKDLGGTELLQPIKYLLNMPVNNKVNVFILTDGQVENIQEIVDNIKDRRKPLMRFFTIGFGKDADRNLCAQIAEVGCGNCRMAVDITNADLQQMLIEQLDISKKDYYYDLQLHIGQHAKILKTQNYVFPNTICKMLTRVSSDKFKDVETVKLTYINSADNMVYGVGVIPKLTVDNNIIKKLFARELIKSIESGEKHEGFNIVDLSLENRIMCTKTSFLIVDETRKVDDNVPLKSVEIPHYDVLLMNNDDNKMSMSKTYYKSSKPLKSVQNTIPIAKEYSKTTSRIPTFGQLVGRIMSHVTPKTSVNYNDDDGDEEEGECDKECEEEDDDNNSDDENLTGGLFDEDEENDGDEEVARVFSKTISKPKDDDSPKITPVFSEIIPKSEDIKINKNDITKYQNFDGSFKYVPEVLSILNITETTLKDVASKSKCTLLKKYHELIREYLTNKPEYKLIIKKLNDYIKTMT